MANPFGLPEVTLNQLGDSTHAINTTTRESVYQPLAVIVTDHDATTSNLTTDWPDGAGSEVSPRMEEHMNQSVAVFFQRRHGEAWEKDNGELRHRLHKAAGTPAVPTDVTKLWPNFDYSTFE